MTEPTPEPRPPVESWRVRDARHRAQHARRQAVFDVFFIAKPGPIGQKLERARQLLDDVDSVREFDRLQFFLRALVRVADLLPVERERDE